MLKHCGHFAYPGHNLLALKTFCKQAFIGCNQRKNSLGVVHMFDMTLRSLKVNLTKANEIDKHISTIDR